MTNVVGPIVDPVLGTDISGEKAKTARRASEGAAATQAAYQTEALDYLKEREALPQQFREQALTRLGGLAGLEGGEGSQQQLIDQAKASPLYGAMIRSGDEAAGRLRSTQGLNRSGTAISDTKRVQDEALLTSMNQQQQQLQGLAMLPSMAPQIASATAGIGQTLGQGQVAAAQGELAAQNASSQQILGLIGAGTDAYTGYQMAAFSDIRLKENIKPIGTVGGHTWYEWVWNELAGKLGLYGKSEGVMAHEVHESQPELIGTKQGYITVDYGNLNPYIDGECMEVA